MNQGLQPPVVLLAICQSTADNRDVVALLELKQGIRRPSGGRQGKERQAEAGSKETMEIHEMDQGISVRQTKMHHRAGAPLLRQEG